jgi:hypothetical protein
MGINEINNSNDLADFLKSINNNYTIVDVEVPVNIQMRYAKMLVKEKGNVIKDADLESVKDKLYDENISLSEKRKLLVRLSESNNVAFFRVLEKYKERAPKELKNWVVLAYQHSKVLLENSLLSEDRVLISTGLGGRGDKLRYFFVLFAKDQAHPLTDWQKSIIQTELELLVKTKKTVELEYFEFAETYVKVKLLFPLVEKVQTVIQSLIDNCNEIGNFMSSQFLATNVKVLSDEEIVMMLKDRQEEGLI